jgi:hypothetical protein
LPGPVAGPTPRVDLSTPLEDLTGGRAWLATSAGGRVRLDLSGSRLLVLDLPADG